MSYEKIKETGNDDLWTFPCQITSRKYNSIQQNKCGVFLYCSAMMKKAQVKHQWAGHSSPRSTSVYHILSLKQPIFFQFSCPNLNYRMMNNCYLFFFYPDQCIVLFWISYFDLRELQVITEIADNSFAESAFKYATLITGKKKSNITNFYYFYTHCIFTVICLLKYQVRARCSVGNGADGSGCHRFSMSPACCSPSSLTQLCPSTRHCGLSSSTSPRILMSWWSTLGTSSTSTQRSSPKSAKAGSSGPRTRLGAGVFFLKTTQREPTSQTRGLSTGWLWSTLQEMGFHGAGVLCSCCSSLLLGECWKWGEQRGPWCLGGKMELLNEKW